MGSFIPVRVRELGRVVAPLSSAELAECGVHLVHLFGRRHLSDGDILFAGETRDDVEGFRALVDTGLMEKLGSGCLV